MGWQCGRCAHSSGWRRRDPSPSCPTPRLNPQPTVPVLDNNCVQSMTACAPLLMSSSIPPFLSSFQGVQPREGTERGSVEGAKMNEVMQVPSVAPGRSPVQGTEVEVESDSGEALGLHIHTPKATASLMLQTRSPKRAAAPLKLQFPPMKGCVCHTCIDYLYICVCLHKAPCIQVCVQTLA